MKHVDESDTIIQGTYRGTIPVTHYFNSKTGVNVMKTADDAFHSGWKLSSDQLKYLLTTGNVQ